MYICSYELDAVEELSELEFTEHANSVDISTFFFLLFPVAKKWVSYLIYSISSNNNNKMMKKSV